MAVDREERRRHVSDAARVARASTGAAEDAPLDCVLTAVEEGIGVPVILVSLGPRLAGIYSPDGASGVIVVAGKDAATRRRFTLAHELGHHCLGHGSRADTDETLLNDKDRREVDANQFAAEFLAPSAALDGFLERLPEQESVLDLVCRVANFFSVSPMMSRIRLTTCGVITDTADISDLDGRIIRGEASESFSRLELRDRDDLCATPEAELPRIPASAQDSKLDDLATGRLSPETFAKEQSIGVEAVRELLRRPPA